MTVEDRALLLTGSAFPIGSMLGVGIGVMTAPHSSQGLQDVAYAMLWFIISGAPATVLTFWFSTARVEWSWAQRKKAMLQIFLGSYIATGLMIAAVAYWGRSGNGDLVFVALPLASLVVTRYARKTLKQKPKK